MQNNSVIYDMFDISSKFPFVFTPDEADTVYGIFAWVVFSRISHRPASPHDGLHDGRLRWDVLNQAINTQ